MPTTRIERDSLGTKRVPRLVYYGIQTHRAVENFPISELRLPWEMVRAYACIKRSAAKANAELKLLPKRYASVIVRACDEILSGKMRNQFVVDVYQAGAGTSFNMNANEVIANRANEILGARKGTYRYIHPNDHVNMAQSTNDTFPTAMRLACLMALPDLLNAMQVLERSLKRKSVQWRKVVKSGRTHLQDAVPVRLGKEFGAYALAVKKCREQLFLTGKQLEELNLGGTATGTGLNSHPRYRHLAVRHLRQVTGLRVHTAEDLTERMQSMADFVRLSGNLRVYAVELIRIANDLRLMSSGPNTGFAEIDLPAVQPGSSIMPGKVNPVIAEMTNMVGFQVMGHDTTVAQASAAGQFELNVMMPVIAYNLLQPIHLLTTTSNIFARRCIDGIVANKAKCEQYAKSSLALVTALNPRIGYLSAAKIAKQSLKTGKSLIKLVIESKLLKPAEAKKLLDPVRLSRGVD